MGQGGYDWGGQNVLGWMLRFLVKCRMIKHGLHGTPTYYVWSAMVQRCTNPRNPAWKYYGGRGISICEEWLQFKNFVRDMGECPRGLTLDRINNDLGYCKSNCEWRTRTLQQNNRRDNLIVSVAGRTQTLEQWCREFGVHRNTIQNRVKRGTCNSYEEALTTPIPIRVRSG